MMDIEASLKVSFLSGLIDVGGSAKYLNDQKKLKNQSRVTFQYKATTNFQQLSIDHVTLDTEQMEHGSCDKEKIPTFDVEGKVDIKLTDEEKALTNKFSCKFYGDFILKINPATFQDAVQTYVELPQLLGTKGENSVPVKVWLMPLKCFDPKAPELMAGISIGLVKKAQDVLGDLKEIRMRCNNSLGDKVAEDFPKIQKDLNTFLKLCGYYESSLQQTMAKKLPSIRVGKVDESSLEEVFEDRNKSPFSHEKLTKWLDHKEREINVIGSVVDIMKDVKIVQNRSELDIEVLGNRMALCFVFTSIESADPCLEAMDQYANSLKWAKTEEEPWYYSDEVLQKMRGKAQDFIAMAKRCTDDSFLIVAIENKKFKGATIYWYHHGILKTEDFKPHSEEKTEYFTSLSEMKTEDFPTLSEVKKHTGK
ncbi:hypothetical protein JOQ06_022409 [Pogonophryne albipinna]|uniref:SNTX thioredoxin-like domain-containing protein n=1 Tax=Pogonophryne albipinna TaxID=1090488 RepID=A0AAD6F536_9TELE|nr:hypothetical protein JOQ06_022409 [Pogonophryne albipinna]